MKKLMIGAVLALSAMSANAYKIDCVDLKGIAEIIAKARMNGVSEEKAKLAFNDTYKDKYPDVIVQLVYMYPTTGDNYRDIQYISYKIYGVCKSSMGGY